MFDSFGRKVNYVRISVTDRCDLRCKYCMPQTNPHLYQKIKLLNLEELKLITDALIKLGMKKIRITGGEPLIRKDIIEYLEYLSLKLNKNCIEELLITTNATQLKKYSKILSEFGIKRINVSLDTLIKEKFNFITNGGNLENVMEGILSAKENGIKIKINTVLLKKFNDDEILNIMKWCSKNDFSVSFIEVMPIGETPLSRTKQYLSVGEAKQIINKEFKLEQSNFSSSGPSKYFFCKKLKLNVGFISPISNHFCLTCNRIRVTSSGIIYPCLGDNNSVDLNPILKTGKVKALENILRDVIYNKPEKHYFSVDDKSYITKRFMNTTGG